jgi:hypothetical protein
MSKQIGSFGHEKACEPVDILIDPSVTASPNKTDHFVPDYYSN